MTVTVTHNDPFIDVTRGPYNARGNGVDDDTEAIQRAIDAAAAADGGTVYFPPGTYRCNVTLPSYVQLVGATIGESYGVDYATPRQATLKAAVAGVVVDTPVSTVTGCGVSGLNILGLGAGTAVTGIRFRSVANGRIRNLFVNNVADEGLLLDAGCGACVIEDVLIVNAVLDRSRAAVIGALDVSGNDHWASRIEATISGSIEGTVQSANLYCAAIAWRGANGFIDAVVGEISDVGIAVSGGGNRWSNCRADLNYGHGWRFAAGGQGGNQVSNCLSLSNSQDTTNTYDNWYVETGTNTFSNCYASTVTAKHPRYGFNDTISSASGKNSYDNPFSGGADTAQYRNETNHGSSFSFPAGPGKPLTANSATPDVSGYESFYTGNTVPTTITDFLGGVSGQRIRIQVQDDNTSLQHNGATMYLQHTGHLKLRFLSVYEFHRSGGAWAEVATLPLAPTANVGDADKALYPRMFGETHVWNTPLTAHRTVTIGGFGDYAGARFHIVRTAAATGAFNLNVGVGPLKALAAGTWCDVEYTGSSWILTGYGAL